MKAPQFVMSDDEVPPDRLRPHGRLEVAVEGQLVRMELTGPINGEFIRWYEETIVPIYREVRARGPFVSLLELTGSALVTDDVVALHRGALAREADSDYARAAVAWVVGPEVEGVSLVPFVRAQMVGDAVIPLRVFERRDEAEAWLQSVLAAG